MADTPETRESSPHINPNVYSAILEYLENLLSHNKHPGKRLGIKSCIGRCNLHAQETDSGKQIIVCTECCGDVVVDRIKLS